MASASLKEITVIGAGISGLSFIKALREKNKAIKITLIEKNKCSFDKNKFIRLLDTKDYINLQEFAAGQKVEFIQETVVKINPERKKIYFKEKELIDFQSLVVASGLKSKDIAVRGDSREGFFYLADIELFAIRDLLRMCDEVIGYVSTILGLRFALSLKALGKEVRLLGSNWDFLSGQKEKVVNFLKEKNIDVHLGVSIEEVIGDACVRATKINPLKVFSSQMVFVDSGFVPNLSFFEPGLIPQGITANYENVYVIGDANAPGIEQDCFYVFNHAEAMAQAVKLSECLVTGVHPGFERKVPTAEDRQKLTEELLATKVGGEIKTV
jgi:NADH dehydrogenase FAD-containing subunit